jgi:hypothetical protein
MSRAQQANILFVGIIIGMVVSQACGGGGGGGGGTANAADECTCTFDASKQAPLPVMICDGQSTDGTCAEVARLNSDSNGLKTF